MADRKTAIDAGFEVLGHGIYLKRPADSLEDSAHPTIILLFGWMGARLPHLLKYTQGYDQLYPSATQILIRCEAGSFWEPRWMTEASLRPAVEALQALGSIGGKTVKQHRILVHTFSNGGCHKLVSLAKQLSKSPNINVSTSATIFDSCPGTGSLSVAIRAFSSVIRFAPLRALVVLWFYAIYSYAYVCKRLFGTPLFWERVRARLNEPRFLPWAQKSSPRLYMYSNTDELIPWQDVESHAKGAKSVFTDVREEKFEGTKHVAHMRQDPERYWRAVADLWNAGSKVA